MSPSIELTILTALADTYGDEIPTNTSLGYALRLVARHGGVALVQRVLWGESASDVQLATMLGAARAPFTQFAGAPQGNYGHSRPPGVNREETMPEHRGGEDAHGHPPPQ
ncbi:hypothetical protein [Caballeronia sp. 15715]|uniref:hypothetical protein n=1 Tax=unclassified Caballeronia TaxID=2646786 RepID=UPI0039E2DFB1